MASLTVYAGTGDFTVSSTNANAATARSGGTLALVTGTSLLSAHTFLTGGNYTYAEAFLPFDTTPLAGGTVTAADLVLTSSSGSGRPLEVRRLSSFPSVATSAFVPQASLGGLTLMGSGNSGASTTTIALTAATVLESSALPILVHHLWHRNNIAGVPVGFEQTFNFQPSDTSGTTNDPRLEITYTPVGGKPKAYVGGSFVEKPLKWWNGSSWVEKPLKVWSGSSWELA